MNGPYIYRKPKKDEVLEHPFRVPTEGGDITTNVYVEYWHSHFEEWNDCCEVKLVAGDVWRPYRHAPPPPELLELAEKVREETE